MFYMSILLAIGVATGVQARENVPSVVPPVVVEPMAEPLDAAEVVVPEVVPVFNAVEANKMVVRITELDGTPRGTGLYAGDDTVVVATHLTMSVVHMPTPYGSMIVSSASIEHMLVENQNGSVVLGTVTSRDHKQDVAIIKLSNNNLSLTAVTFATAIPSRGDKVFMIGHPLGFTWALSRGYVSREVMTMSGGIIRGLVSLLGTNGSSGSPLFNERGEVIGMATEVFTSGSGLLYVPNYVFQHKIETE